MRILALQLKRIGDLILTTPAIDTLKKALPDSHLTLAVHTSTAPLLPAIPGIDSGVVFGPGRGWTPWQQSLTGSFDVVLDFTGTDRSALAAAMTQAPQRLTFEWVRKNRARALAFHGFVDSPVREMHTVEHYVQLARAVLDPALNITVPDGPLLEIPPAARTRAQELLSSHGIAGQFVIIHPGTARPEKFWKADRWA
ncbi:MAG: glycosyltransferase family 9 protein, partial [Chthoniobacteraceae bacterium]